MTGLALVVIFGLYGAKLVQIQAIDADALAADALAERLVEYDSPAVRGDILDREGDVLATTATSVTVTADPSMVATFVDRDDPRRAGPRAAAALLAPLLNVDAATITTALSGEGRFAVVAKDVAPDVWREIDAMQIQGIFHTSDGERDYPAGRVGAGVIGFVGSDGGGLAGLELAHDAELTGVDGWTSYERSGENRNFREIPGGAADEQAPVHGDDITLTLDRDLQWQAEQAILRVVANSGAQNASVIAIDAVDGTVLAMANAPGFDPNDVDGTPAERLGNRAVNEVFEPGSTSKVITVAAAMEAGLVVPTTPFSVPDSIQRGGQTFNDSHSHAVLSLTLSGILAESSNTGTIMASDGLSAAQLHDWFGRFGYGRVSGVGLPGESAGLLPPAEQWSASQRYTVVFGQGISVTALQMASVFQTIANDGVRIPPRIVAGRTTADATWVPAATAPAEQVLSVDTAVKLQRMLESVVSEDGTGAAAAVEGYRVAGKTGTAERYDERCGGYCGYTASFVGFAPAGNPRIVVAVAIQDPVRGIYGGTTAAPVFADVMTAALAELRVPADAEPAELYPLTW